MNLNDLYPVQKELDNYIGESKNINMEDYKTERKIALQVEFNELLNELPFLFKYWSNKQMDRSKVLEEYIDNIHFLLSIGNDYGIESHEYKRPNVQDMRTLAIGINNMISRLRKENYGTLVNHYILLGEKLGFDEKTVKDAYFEKNNTNYERQRVGY